MNDRLKICRRILQTTGGVALLLWGGCAGAGENSGGRKRLKVLPDSAQDNSEKDKTVASLKAEMADMSVVTAEMLKPDDMQQSYAVGVMLGRDVLNLQVTS